MDGIHLIDAAGDDGADEDGHADVELPGGFRGRGEVVGRHQQEAGGGQ